MQQGDENTEVLAGAEGPVRAELHVQSHEDSCSNRLIVFSRPKLFSPGSLGAVKTSCDIQRSRPLISLSLPPPPAHHRPTHTEHTHGHTHADRVHSVWPPAVWPQMGGFLSESFPDVTGFHPFFHSLSSPFFPSPWSVLCPSQIIKAYSRTMTFVCLVTSLPFLSPLSYCCILCICISDTQNTYILKFFLSNVSSKHVFFNKLSMSNKEWNSQEVIAEHLMHWHNIIHWIGQKQTILSLLQTHY